jgi:hypothetical protein
MGVRAFVDTRLQDESLEKTEAYRIFRHPGREADRRLRLAGTTRKSRC